MKKFAVSYIGFHDNKLITKIINAESREYALRDSEFYDKDGLDYLQEAPTFEDAKQHAFDMDSMFEVMEIPND